MCEQSVRGWGGYVEGQALLRKSSGWVFHGCMKCVEPKDVSSSATCPLAELETSFGSTHSTLAYSRPSSFAAVDAFTPFAPPLYILSAV